MYSNDFKCIVCNYWYLYPSNCQTENYMIFSIPNAGNYFNKPAVRRSSLFLCTNPMFYCNFFAGLNKTILGYFGLPLLYMVPHQDGARREENAQRHNYVHPSMHAHICVYVRIHTHIYIYILCIHTHIYIYTMGFQRVALWCQNLSSLRVCHHDTP